MHACALAHPRQDVGLHDDNEDFADVDEFDEEPEVTAGGIDAHGLEDGAGKPTRLAKAGATSGLKEDKTPFKVVIAHCPSVAMTAIATEFQERLQHIYPKAVVTAEISDPTPVQRTLQTMVMIVQMLIIAYCWFGRRIHARLGIATPEWYKLIESSPLYPIMFAYYLGTIAQDRIVATGQFDVTVDGHDAWSTGTPPSSPPPTWQQLLWKLEALGLPRIAGADDTANWPSGWQDVKEADTTAVGGS